jgi:hypothetical protein
MAVNVSVYDLVNYPDNSKTVTVDIKQVTPIGYEGDEQWVVSCVTTAYSNNTDRTAIQDIYIQNMRQGWLKGMEASGPFTITSGTNAGFEIKLDADPTWRHIDIPTDTYTGDALADWLETEIRALNSVVSSTYQLAYMNMSVKYEDGRFQFVSGSASEDFIGANRSSVAINADTLDKPGPGGQDPCAHTLGLDFPSTSESLATFAAKEGRVDGSYTAGNTTLNTKEYGWDATTFSGAVYAITSDLVEEGGFENSTVTYEYFICVGGSPSAMTIRGAHASGGLLNNYDPDDKIVMFDGPQDPQAVPTAWNSEVDGVVRWGIKSIANQIDYSS